MRNQKPPPELKMDRYILRTIIIVTLVCTQPIFMQFSFDNEQLPELEKVDLEVPAELKEFYPFSQNQSLFVPKGYRIRVYGFVPDARFLLTLPNGDVLVSQPWFSNVTILQPPISTNQLALHFNFANDLNHPHDMVFYTDQSGTDFIYVSEANRVARYRYVNGNTKIGLPEVIVDNLPVHKHYMHYLKNIAIGNNSLYVSIASASNADPADLMQDPKHGAIYKYTLTGGERKLVSEGIRNAEGLAFTPDTNELWMVNNQRDRIKYPYIDNSNDYGYIVADYVDENPPEEFGKVEAGKNYGWPFCNPSALKSMDELEYVPDFDTNPNETVINCSIFRIAEKGMEPHSAPLGLTFWTGDNVPSYFKNGALVALHGSWNRQTYSGHKVVFYPWINGKPGAAYDLVSGWVVDAVKKIRWGRPVDTAILFDGSVLISDDYFGAIYQLYKT